MKKIQSMSWAMLVVMLCSVLGACNQFEPTGYEEVAALPTPANVQANVQDRVVTVTWAVPQSEDLTGVIVMADGDWNARVTLPATATSYQFEGQPMGVDVVYTVKAVYGEKMSVGASAVCQVPKENLGDVTGLKADVSKRTVTLTWQLPADQANITGVRVSRNGEVVATLPAGSTSCRLKAQPMENDMTYTVQPMYYTYYPSEGASVKATVEYLKPKVGFLLLADTPDNLPDDDEVAAAAWFKQEYVDKGEGAFVTLADFAQLDSDEYPVFWVMIDRIGQPNGWQNLPEVSSEANIAVLRQYTKDGGALYLSNMATMLTEPLDIVGPGQGPNIFGSGAGGSGTDVWLINPHLGWDFQNGSDQGYYDRAEHAIFAGIELEDPNGYGFTGVPLIGPGQREDHNCMWDLNAAQFGKGNYPDVIKNFEVMTNSLVLATWGHVRDHCVAGLVEFYATDTHARCVANGFAAYEWNQNSGTNIYQANVEKLTKNILEYLK